MKNKKLLKWFVYLMLWPVSLSYWIIQKTQWPQAAKWSSVAVLWVVLFATAIVLNSPLETPASPELNEEITVNTVEETEDTTLQDQIEKENLQSDLDQLQKMYADLKERYQDASSNQQLEFETVWITNWNRQLNDLREDYSGYTLNKNDQYGVAKARMAESIEYLDTLWKEYEADLQGLASEYETFEDYIEESFEMVEENLQE